ncbi:hypothetical protein F511_22646 [Dorcoceras hygrometricum]|uniref:Uncharacterized protein n=1 Tax=Dorcoceras hygrometricum TaxID=472368 RepID=A0A2Z7BNB8_9LAMI|nr:hypothetical protein F511_22646 [Dorcoceras hygrometricum]
MMSALLTERNQKSAVDKERKSWISDDEVSNDVSNQKRVTVLPAVGEGKEEPAGTGFEKSTGEIDRRRRFKSQLQAYRYHQLDNQTQATAHPVVSYNEPAVAMNPVARLIQSKATLLCNPVDKEFRQKRKAVVGMNQQRSS